MVRVQVERERARGGKSTRGVGADETWSGEDSDFASFRTVSRGIRENKIYLCAAYKKNAIKAILNESADR